jgi:hypothetical protein
MSGKTPKFFSLLNEIDQKGYRELRQRLASMAMKRHRGYRLDHFQEMLTNIRNFAQRGDKDDWKRCCVCGLCYLPSGIALNSHQLKHLTGKCKSSINGALKMLGYITTSARGDINPELVAALPNLKGKTRDLRQWSIRTPENYSLPQIGSCDKKESRSEESDHCCRPRGGCSAILDDFDLAGSEVSNSFFAFSDERTCKQEEGRFNGSANPFFDDLRGISEDDVRQWSFWEV